MRAIVKWDYELRNGQQLETVIDRALTVATSRARRTGLFVVAARSPGGAASGFSCDDPARRIAAGPAGPRQARAIDEAAIPCRGPTDPLIFTASAGRDPAAVEAFADFAERFAIPVVRAPSASPVPSCGPSVPFGYDAGPISTGADAILVVECDVREFRASGSAGPMADSFISVSIRCFRVSDPRVSVRARADRSRRFGVAGARRRPRAACRAPPSCRNGGAASPNGARRSSPGGGRPRESVGGACARSTWPGPAPASPG